VFRSLTELQDRCPTCAFGFVREEGYWLGAMAVIFAIVEVVFGALLVVTIASTWPDVPWTPLLIAGLVLNGVVPFVGYGWAKTIWMGVHYAFSPATATEEAEAATHQAAQAARAADGAAAGTGSEAAAEGE
jgi:uncharacterized protein (DUF983 family)